MNELKKRPEESGTMLDYSLVVLCTEVADGNDHLHDNMPFVVGGGGGGAVRTGRLLQFPYRRHSDLLVGIAQAMGAPIASFGEACAGSPPGFLA